MGTVRKAAVSLAVGLVALCALPAVAQAETYYVYACSSYGNAAPAFGLYSSAGHLSPANECMQPAAGGGYRSLEINDPNQASVLRGYGAIWTAYTPSPAIAIV